MHCMQQTTFSSLFAVRIFLPSVWISSTFAVSNLSSQTDISSTFANSTSPLQFTIDRTKQEVASPYTYKRCLTSAIDLLDHNKFWIIAVDVLDIFKTYEILKLKCNCSQCLHCAPAFEFCPYQILYRIDGSQFISRPKLSKNLHTRFIFNFLISQIVTILHYR